MTSFQTPNKQHDYHLSLLKKAKVNQTPVEWELPEPVNHFIEEGATLMSLSQSKAYKLIRKKKTKNIKKRTLTKHSIDSTVKYFKRTFGKIITEKTIWKSQRKKVIPKNISDFLWKITHDAIKCGKFFANMPTWADKQFCPCHGIESIKHILFDCRKFGNTELWSLVKTTWNKIHPNIQFTEPNIDILKGIGIIKIFQNKIWNQQATKLYVHLILETVWAIWKSRNERRIANKTISKRRLRSRWASALKIRILTEWTLTNQLPFPKQELAKNNFIDCWLVNEILGSRSEETLTITIPKN